MDRRYMSFDAGDCKQGPSYKGNNRIMSQKDLTFILLIAGLLLWASRGQASTNQENRFMDASTNNLSLELELKRIE